MPGSNLMDASDVSISLAFHLVYRNAGIAGRSRDGSGPGRL